MANLNMLIPNYPKLKRSGLKKAIIHNMAGSASAKQEAIRLKAKTQWQNGNAHKFIDENDCVTVIDMSLVSYNCDNRNMNCNSISYEVCKSRGNKNTFLKAEQNTFKLVVADLKRYGKGANIIELHRNIVATACPHRSQEIHGTGKKCLDYFKKEVQKYMGNTSAGDKPIGKAYFMGTDGKECYVHVYSCDKVGEKINGSDRYATPITINSKGRAVFNVKTGKKVNTWTTSRTRLFKWK